MGAKLTRTKMKMIPSITPAIRAISLRIIGSLMAMLLLLWTIHYGYEAATEARRSGQWTSQVGALIMLFGFLLSALGLPIIADLFLRLSDELRYPEETDINHGRNQGSFPV
ncbi:hypothetical protein L6164_037574 [Bauhinia variegata]|uniref:Uncharacterized protein n=1 Tax=Bauhinia variegata TaxID=167791 RepID=A0ACB9KKF7_BAUVA|nr:hypothetical protein L6164_037574 [Bauhinia variegata]